MSSDRLVFEDTVVILVSSSSNQTWNKADSTASSEFEFFSFNLFLILAHFVRPNAVAAAKWEIRPHLVWSSFSIAMKLASNCCWLYITDSPLYWKKKRIIESRLFSIKTKLCGQALGWVLHVVVYVSKLFNILINGLSHSLMESQLIL